MANKGHSFKMIELKILCSHLKDLQRICNETSNESKNMLVGKGRLKNYV